VIAYAGVPLTVQGEAIGAFCVVDNKPRVWSDDELQLLADLAASVVSEIELRMALRSAREQAALSAALVDSLGDGVMAINTDREFMIVNASARAIYADTARVGRPLPPNWAELHRAYLATGEPLAAENGALPRALRGETTDGLEYSVQRPGADTALWLEANGRPVRDANGKIIAAIAVYRDITARKRSVDLFATLARNIPGGAVALFDRDLQCIAIEGGLVRAETSDLASLTGISMQALAGRLGQMPAFAQVESAYRGALAGDQIVLDVVVNDRTYMFQVGPVRDALGAITCGIVLVLDISEQRRDHVAVRRNEQLYRAIVQNLPDGCVFTIDKDLRYLSADGPALRAIMKRSSGGADDLIGRRVADVVSASNRDAMLEMLGSALSGTPARIQIARGRQSFELAAEPLTDPSGEISSALLFCFDITARKEGARLLQTFSLMVEAISDYAIFHLDRDGRVTTWNAGARAIKGYENDEIVGRHIRAFYPPTEPAKADRVLALAREHGRFEEEGWRVRKDGTPFWASVAITALHDPSDGSLTGFVKITRDLTERKQVEDGKVRALAEKTAMLQEIHHRVKNNLQMISSLLNLQARQIKDPTARGHFLDTQSRVRSIALLHESLYQTADLGHVDLREYVDKLVASLRRAYGDPVRFEIEIEAISLPLTSAVPCGLVINELITNSLKHAFAGDGDGMIRVVAETEGDCLALTVRDNGPGYPAQLVESMGLSLVRDLSAQLGGSATFSTSGGACCTITFAAVTG